jgi:MFS family permease
LLAAEFAARDVISVAGFLIAGLALAISLFFVRDTARHVEVEQAAHSTVPDLDRPPLRSAFAEATYRSPALRSCSQAGLVNNLNDALAWGLVPLFLASHGVSVARIAVVAGIYPAVWGIGQIAAGAWSDRAGRKPLIVSGMLLQAVALGGLAASDGTFTLAVITAATLGIGTALVYPTLLAAISDQVVPFARAPTIGVYRFWRDMGYVIGGLVAGVAADLVSFEGAIALVAAATAASGVWVWLELPMRGARTSQDTTSS